MTHVALGILLMLFGAFFVVFRQRVVRAGETQTSAIRAKADPFNVLGGAAFFVLGLLMVISVNPLA